jgi:GntR family transcriptional regulator/MocR family aminotransferase
MKLRRDFHGALPVLTIDREDRIPLHKQIYDGYRAAILRGDLRAGEQISSSRDFAAALKISRFPVLNAYAQLLAEGYLESRTGSGTFVSATLPERLMSPAPAAGARRPPLSGKRSVSMRSGLYPLFPDSRKVSAWGAFGVHQPALDQFPFALWSNLVARHSRNPHVNVVHRIDPCGSQRFREVVSDYLRTARGVKCSPDHILIVSGSQQALDLTTRVLLDPGNSVWVEEPGYTLQKITLKAAECKLIPVPVDSEGMNVAAGIKRAPKARAAFVTPSHQYPLGSTMSASRRIQLLNWAQDSGAWIVEDDYDSEFRFDSPPIASLHGLDVNARVIYIGTFSKVLFPALRLGYLVVPEDLIDRFKAVRHAMDIFPSYLLQEALADFILEGHFTRHIRKMRQLYKAKRTILAETIALELPAERGFQVHGVEAGMHLALTIPPGSSDLEIAERARAARLWLWPLSPSYLGRNPRQGFVLGFGSAAITDIPRSVQLLKSFLI